MAISATSALSPERPFPGLRPFSPHDQRFFFGRNAQSFALYRLLNLSRFVAVIGQSGSGKSSLARAGLLPLLEEESREPNGRRWQWVEMRPGDRPLHSLVQAITRLGERLSTADDTAIADTRAERIAYHLRGSSHGVGRAVAEMDKAGSRTIVLLVDQFEELFRFASAGGGIGPREQSLLRDEAVHFVQLLLEASRSPAAKVHVLITMRSDFIGDCARFQGLPEAVSGTQFLVPSLTRDQMEEVIKGPVALAGAAIDPQLIERLLNDGSDELDQLPVLQHCLLRLWERAGLRAASDAAEKGEPPARRITLREYDDIHGIAGALSQHADEILSTDLAGLEPLVARVFRALSELDRDGRATRRALAFSRLAAETAIDEATLRTILDRLRADDCSFLTPSPAVTRSIEGDTRIDVGHEALLRHWERVSGAPGATGERADRRPVGWLREEHEDGERYQVLLAMTKGDDGDTALLSPGQFTRYWTWWSERPRTPAWAQRYGGGLDRVERLLLESKAEFDAVARRREEEERRRRAAGRTKAAAVVLGALFGISLGGGYLIYGQSVEARARERVANRTAQLAHQTFKHVVDGISEGTIRGIGSLADARNLLDGVEGALDDAPNTAPEIMALKADIAISLSDFMSAFGETQDAAKWTDQALDMVELIEAEAPDHADLPRLIYAAQFRAADAALALRLDEANVAAALDRYRLAQRMAEQLHAADPANGARLYDLAFVHNKAGEMLQYQRDFPSARAELDKALDYANRAAKSDPENISWQRYVAATHGKIGNFLAWRSDYGGALESLGTAIAIQEELLKRAPANYVLISNNANAHRDRARILVQRWQAGDFEAAVKDYAMAIARLSRLSEQEPDDVRWLVSLAASHAQLGRAYEKAGDLANALSAAQEEFELRRRLVERDPSNERWKANLENATEKVRDLTSRLEARADGGQAGGSEVTLENAHAAPP